MKKGNKMSRLKVRKRRREKRHRYEKRLKRRIERAILGRAMEAEAEEKIGERNREEMGKLQQAGVKAERYGNGIQYFQRTAPWWLRLLRKIFGRRSKCRTN